MSLKKRFVLAVALFTALIMALWFGYHNIMYGTYSQSARENAELAAGRLLDQVGAEISQMSSVAGVIAASSYVQDFLSADTVEMFYGSVGTVSEIIRNAAYPISTLDSVITINAAGNYYRFSGGLSNNACGTLYNSFQGAGASYTIIELDGVLFFCHSTPVFMASGHTPNRVGTVILLTNLNRKRSALDSTLAGTDTAVLLDSVILLSNDTELEGEAGAVLDRDYGLVVRKDVAGTNLLVAAAVRREALVPGNMLFIATSLVLLVLLLIAVTVLFKYLSNYMIRPMTSVINGVASLDAELKNRLPELPAIGKPDFYSLVLAINGLIDRSERYNKAELLQRDMQIGLLISQIDAHFVVNAITSIQSLSLRGDNERAGRMADGLARLIKHRHSGEALRNLFVELEMIREYVALMNIRYDDKFIAEYDVDDRLVEALIPGFILQPVVENALTHGLGSKDGGAVLRVRGHIKEDVIILQVSDNGLGMEPGRLKELQVALGPAEIGDFPEPGLSGVSLTNIQRRIRLRFGSEYGLSVDSVPGEETTVTIKLPMVFDDNP